MSVKDRVVIISGASGGLGRVAAQRFAAEGAKLVLLGRSLDKLEELAADLELPNELVLNQAVDLSDRESTEDAAEAVLQKFGRIEILLNFVGGWIGGKPVVETEAPEIEQMLQQHVHASHSMLKGFTPHMLASGWGRIVGVSSPTASRPPGNNSPYAIGKAGLEALMLSLAEEIKGSGVTANILLVNTIDTKHERENNPSRKNQNWTTPEEICATILHLCGDEARMINGARIPLYGSQ